MNVPLLLSEVGDMRTGTVKSVLLAILKVSDYGKEKWKA